MAEQKEKEQKQESGQELKQPPKDHLTREERKIIREKRRALRREAKKNGLSNADFQIMARQAGLSFGAKDGLAALWWGLVEHMGVSALIAGAVVTAVTLAIVYNYSELHHKKEEYTIALSANMLRVGFDLSDTEDFENPQTYLTSNVLEGCNAMSVQDLPKDLDMIPGEHNSGNYLAYTFWLRNHGEETINYDWQLTMLTSTKTIDDAVWVMIYDEGKQIIYAKAPEGYEQEKLVGYDSYPLFKDAKYPRKQYYENEKGKGIATTPFVSDYIVTEGTVQTFKPDDKHKYTVVMWIEGDDPDCNDSNLGGKIMFNFKFAISRDKDGEVFDDFIYEEEEFYPDWDETAEDDLEEDGEEDAPEEDEEEDDDDTGEDEGTDDGDGVG